jgi:hypothetical protein
MVHFVFISFLPFVFANTNKCDRYMYNQLYQATKYTLWDTNLVCQSIQTPTSITDYYCGDSILKSENQFDKYVLPSNNYCSTPSIRSNLRELRINLETLNSLICNEINSKNLITIPENTTDIFCRIHSSNSTSYSKNLLFPIFLFWIFYFA